VSGHVSTSPKRFIASKTISNGSLIRDISNCQQLISSAVSNI
jgi:hypothetical protein